MQDLNRGKLAALLTAVEQGSTLTKSTICTIVREILETEFYEDPDADWPMPGENGNPAPESGDGGTPESGKEPSDQSDRSDRSDRSDIVKYGRELAANGAAGVRDIIVWTMERFGLTKLDMAKLLGIGSSTMCKYLNHGRCRNAVVTAAAALWGDENGGTPKSTRSPAQPGEAAQTLPTATFGGKDQSDLSDPSDSNR